MVVNILVLGLCICVSNLMRVDLFWLLWFSNLMWFFGIRFNFICCNIIWLLYFNVICFICINGLGNVVGVLNLKLNWLVWCVGNRVFMCFNCLIWFCVCFVLLVLVLKWLIKDFRWVILFCCLWYLMFCKWICFVCWVL